MAANTTAAGDGSSWGWWFSTFQVGRTSNTTIADPTDPSRRRNYLYSRINNTLDDQHVDPRNAAVDELLLDPTYHASSVGIEEEEDCVESDELASGLWPRMCQLWSQLTLSEVSGSCGDLGTFIPLFVALGRQRSIDVAPALFLAGLSNFITGYVWDLPLPVQPMKTIAAVALVGELTQMQVTTSGVWMGILLLALGLTNAIELVNRIVPRSVVAGLQMGVGAGLALRGIEMMVNLTWASHLDCRVLAIVSFIAALFMMREGSRAPVGIVLFGVSALIALGQIVVREVDNQTTTQDSWSILEWSLHGATWSDWRIGLLEGAIPQLPLSTLNTVISTCSLVQSLYPRKLHPPTRRQMSISVGVMNLFLCPLGAMPTCHGAGGLAGQHKFGARHGASVVLLGSIKMLLPVVFGGSILYFLDLIPAGILGVMLAISGHSLALTGWTSLLEQSPPPNVLRQDATVALLTMLAILGLKKTHYGALCGWIAHMIYGNGLSEWRRNNTAASTSGIMATQEINGEPSSTDPLMTEEFVSDSQSNSAVV